MEGENVARMRRETEEYLKKIRKTIKDGENVIAEAELRIAETDRLLEKEGLTREQLSKLTFTDEQKAAVNAELKRLGLEPFSDDDDDGSVIKGGGLPPDPDAVERDGNADNRKRKFGVMMQQFRM